ncbi:MAG: hypothetical protein NVS2B17_17580 [Candidatus Velthaea sp.]
MQLELDQVVDRRFIDFCAVAILSIIAILVIQSFNPTRPVPGNIVAASFLMGPALAAFGYGCLRLAFADSARGHKDH